MLIEYSFVKLWFLRRELKTESVKDWKLFAAGGLGRVGRQKRSGSIARGDGRRRFQSAVHVPAAGGLSNAAESHAERSAAATRCRYRKRQRQRKPGDVLGQLSFQRIVAEQRQKRRRASRG